MRILTEVKKWFETADERALADFSTALKLSSFPVEARRECEELSSGECEFVSNLRGENGSPRLLRTPGTQKCAVLKTYESYGDPVSGAVIENKDRLDLLREEAAAFLISQFFPLVQVPATVLREITPETKKNWRIPFSYDSDRSSLDTQTVMLQRFVPEAQEFVRVHRPIPEVMTAEQVFGLLVFDYLIAYGDGRMANLLVNSDGFWAIDHGKSFRMPGSIRGTTTLGIPDSYTLENTSELLRILNPEQAKIILPVLERLLGKKKTTAFAERFAKAHTLISAYPRILVGELTAHLNPHPNPTRSE
jgi:hypothetical protein